MKRRDMKYIISALQAAKPLRMPKPRIRRWSNCEPSQEKFSKISRLGTNLALG